MKETASEDLWTEEFLCNYIHIYIDNKKNLKIYNPKEHLNAVIKGIDNKMKYIKINE